MNPEVLIGKKKFTAQTLISINPTSQTKQSAWPFLRGQRFVGSETNTGGLFVSRKAHSVGEGGRAEGWQW